MSNELATYRPERELLDRWETELERDVSAGDISEATRQTYWSGMLGFYVWVTERKIDRVSLAIIQDWKAEQLSRGFRPSTVNVWLAGVKRFFAWAAGSGMLSVNPTAGVKNVKRKGTNKKHLRDALTDREVLRVLRQPDRSTTQGKRDYAILALMAFCALREIEIQRADLADLSTVDGLPVLRVQGKGSSEKDETAVIYHPTAQDALYDWLGARGNKPGPLFVSLSNRSQGKRMSTRAVRDLVRYIRAAGVTDERKTLHSLRHSAISKVARKDLLKARQVARHSSIDTTMIYVHEADRLDNPGEQYIDYINGNGE